MRYSFMVHQKFAKEAGITTGNALLVFEILATASEWADQVCLGEECYNFTARQMVSEELTLWGLKPDTVYRHFKSLVELGLIEFKKRGKQDLTRLTDKGKSVFGDTKSTSKLGNRSEKGADSEIDSTESGNGSENNSEIDPTYPNTRYIPTTKKKEKAEKPSLLENQKQERQEPDPRILGGNCQKPDKTCRCPKCKTAVLRLLANNQTLWGKDRYFDCPSRNTMHEHWSAFNTDLSVESILDEITRSIANGEYRKGDMKPFATVIDHAIATLEYAK